MNIWIGFWTVWLLLAGLAFAGITLIVAAKGFRDLRTMFTDLSKRADG
jgi:UPF0716 family protein affecting phage T7 exclusion